MTDKEFKQQVFLKLLDSQPNVKFCVRQTLDAVDSLNGEAELDSHPAKCDCNTEVSLEDALNKFASELSSNYSLYEIYQTKLFRIILSAAKNNCCGSLEDVCNKAATNVLKEFIDDVLK